MQELAPHGKVHVPAGQRATRSLVSAAGFSRSLPCCRRSLQPVRRRLPDVTLRQALDRTQGLEHVRKILVTRTAVRQHRNI